MHRYVRNKRKGEPFDVYIGRPGFWGNPFAMKQEADRERVLVEYWDWLIQTPEGAQRLARVQELRGRTLGCWCHPRLCHGHILARLANDGDPGYEYCERRIEELRRSVAEK